MFSQIYKNILNVNQKLTNFDKKFWVLKQFGVGLECRIGWVYNAGNVVDNIHTWDNGNNGFFSALNSFSFSKTGVVNSRSCNNIYIYRYIPNY